MSEEAQQLPPLAAAMRVCFQKLYDRICALDDAPDGIEFYEWHEVPFNQFLPAQIRIVDELAAAELEEKRKNEPSPIEVLPIEEAMQPTEPRDPLPTVEFTPKHSGNIMIMGPDGQVEFPYWVGWSRYHKMAVICCGPQKVTK